VIPGDRASASVRVDVPIDDAFDFFTREIDLWWRRGPKYRQAGMRAGLIHLEPKLDGRVFESIDTGAAQPTVVEIGRVRVWAPPQRLVFSWRGGNFGQDEITEVEVRFLAQGESTLVTVVHSGWAALRLDHPVRHGLAPSPFCAAMAQWWGEQLTALRRCAALPRATR
jgi:uncharacterized protein YndB with AHSA1/START domain